MYIELIEELNKGYTTEPFMKNVNDLIESNNQFNSTDSLYVPAEGVHSIITGNYTYYEPNCLKESVPLWTTPYGIPIIYNHKEQDSKIIGRIKKAEYVARSERTKTPALKFILGIGDKEGKEGVQNGTLRTLSIGARAKDLRCSICGKNIAKEGFCEHEKGRYYDGKLCYWVVKRIEPKEISYVIVPSDKYAYSEDPITNKKEVARMAESNNEKEVNDLSNNIFEDIFSQSLAEFEENRLREDAEQDDKVKPDKKDDPVPQEPKDDPEPPEEPKGEDKKDDEEPEVKPEEGEDQDQEKDESKVDDDMDEKAKAIIKDMEEQIKKLSRDLAFFKNKYKEEAKLREAAEQDRIKIENVVKHDLVEKINELRTSFGLSEKDENLQMQTSIELLESEFRNLSEVSNSSITCIKSINKLNSTALVDDKMDNTCKEIKESQDDIPEQNLDDMFGRFTRRNK